MHRSLILAIALLLAVPASAQLVSIPLGGPKKVRPSPNADLPGSPAGIDAAVAAPGRPPGMVALDEIRRPAELLAFAGLALGTRVLVAEPDRYYAEIVGTALGPGGRVTALVPPAELRADGPRAALAALIGRAPAVTPLAGTLATATLPPARYDLALLHLSLHEADPAMVATRLFAAMRPAGRVVIVDHAAAVGMDAAAARSLGRLDPAAVTAAFIRAGFVADGSSRGLADRADDHTQPADDGASSDRFVLRFVRPE